MLRSKVVSRRKKEEGSRKQEEATDSKLSGNLDLKFNEVDLTYIYSDRKSFVNFLLPRQQVRGGLG
ncbi:MAG: hypothetical protein ACRC62_05605 [Microcoleus sp.]